MSRFFGVSKTAEREAASGTKNDTEPVLPVCSLPVRWLHMKKKQNPRNTAALSDDDEGKNRLLIFYLSV